MSVSQRAHKKFLPSSIRLKTNFFCAYSRFRSKWNNCYGNKKNRLETVKTRLKKILIRFILFRRIRKSDKSARQLQLISPHDGETIFSAAAANIWTTPSSFLSHRKNVRRHFYQSWKCAIVPQSAKQVHVSRWWSKEAGTRLNQLLKKKFHTYSEKLNVAFWRKSITIVK